MFTHGTFLLKYNFAKVVAYCAISGSGSAVLFVSGAIRVYEEEVRVVFAFGDECQVVIGPFLFE